MKLTKTFILLFYPVFIICCSSDNGDSNPIKEETANPPEEQVLIPDPLAATLIFPVDNTECNEGEIENDTNSKVTFEWDLAENTDSYEIRIRNLNTYNTQTEQTTSNSISISILRGTPYEWYVISKAEGTTKTVTSEVWQFYNEGNGNESYAPFPATLTYPLNGAVIEYGDDRLELQWEGNDLDNDILEYEVFFGVEEVPSNSAVITSETKYYFWSSTFTLGTTFYWRVKTTDSQGNSSLSQTFSCVVN